MEPKNSNPLECAPPATLTAIGSNGGTGARCSPTLLLGLPSWVMPALGHVLRNDLAFATSSTWNRSVPVEVRLNMLNYMNAPELVNLTKSFGGAKVVTKEELYSPEGDFLAEKLEGLLRNHQFQAIITDDSSILNEAAVRSFVQERYCINHVSVVIMSIEGIFDLSPLHDIFSVDWRAAAYTTRTVALTVLGQQIISTNDFPKKQYCKALFVTSPSRSEEEELFVDYKDPADYSVDTYEDDEESENAGPPPPDPGSPVITQIEPSRAVSYFGFVNDMDVDYGAILLRLCYAAHHKHGINYHRTTA